MQKISILVICILMIISACSESIPSPKYPDKLPITEQAENLVKPPPYMPPQKAELVEPINLGESAPFSGLILDEMAALRVAQLRIAYDEVYQLNLAHNKYMLFVIGVQEQELYRADQIIDQKEATIRKIRDSWWQQNKLIVGTVMGVVLGIGISITTGIVWSKIDDDK